MELTQKTSLQKLKERNYMRYQNYILKITQSSLPYGIIFYFMILLNLIFLFIEINLSKKIFGMINYSFFLATKILYFCPANFRKYIYILGIIVLLILKIKYKKNKLEIMMGILIFYEYLIGNIILDIFTLIFILPEVI